jgi:hypothetical protein
MKRLYGLFERQRGTRKWTRRFPELSFDKPTAIRVWQSHLLAPYLDHGGTSDPPAASYERCLRPVTRAVNLTPYASRVVDI